MKRTSEVVLIMLALLWPGLVQARFVAPKAVPVDRVVANMEAWLEENPNDARAVYSAARAHYLAMVTEKRSIGVFEQPGDGPLVVADDFFQGWGGAGEVDELAEEDAKAHAAAAHAHFHRALELEPGNPLYLLGLASLQMQYLQRAEERGWEGLPDGWDEVTLLETREIFFDAWEAGKEDASEREFIPLKGLRDLVSFEAGNRFLELAAEVDDGGDDPRNAEVEAFKAKLEGLRRGPITPVIVGPVGSTLDDLEAPDLEVEFDLDGDLVVERWSWVHPEAGILVWDPEGRGEILSGRQLFGNATWWMLFSDGYRALDALDDDRSGALSGDELEGISVWRDRDSDGVSDPGEVVPVEEYGLVQIATRGHRADEGGTLWNPDGARTKDGRVLPSFDWVAEGR